jgi:hypothetical protein
MLSGTPTTSGTSNFTITVTDALNRQATKAFSLQVVNNIILAEPYRDDFEAPTFNPFWTINGQQGGTISPCSDQNDTPGGNQSACFAVSGSGQKTLVLQHQYALPVKGHFSVWFYDSLQTYYNFLTLYNTNSNTGPSVFVGAQDFDPTCYEAALDTALGRTGPQGNCGFFSNAATTNVHRTVGWHKLEITAGASSLAVLIDGIRVLNAAGSYTFNAVTLELFGPESATTKTYFDDFSVNDNTVFTDDFSSTTLNPAWQNLPGLGSYTLGGGQLRYFNEGFTAATTGWNNAALTLALPFNGMYWQVDTKATYHLFWLLPGYNYTGPSVPTPNGSAGAQGPEVVVKFNPSVNGTNYAGSDFALFERNIDAYYGANTLSASYGTVSNGNLLCPADGNITNNVADGTYWLQIIRNGGTVTMNYSCDGTNYRTAISTVLANPVSTYNELMLGGLTFLSDGSYTDYSYVTIKSLGP